MPIFTDMAEKRWYVAEAERLRAEAMRASMLS